MTKTKLQELREEMEALIASAGGEAAPGPVQDLLKGVSDAFAGIDASLATLLALAKGKPDAEPAAGDDDAADDEGGEDEPGEMDDAPEPGEDEPDSAEDALAKALASEDVVDVSQALVGFAAKVDRLEKCLDTILANQKTQRDWQEYYAAQADKSVSTLAKGMAEAIQGQVEQIGALAKGVSTVQTAINAGPRGGVSLLNGPGAGAARHGALPAPAAEGDRLTHEQLAFALNKCLASDLQVTTYENRGCFSYDPATNAQVLQTVRTAWQEAEAAAKPRA